jgi:hypothetical protein
MSKAFWQGFWEGLACPTQIYAVRPVTEYQKLGSIETAWKQVGGYIREAAEAVEIHAEPKSTP